MFINLSKNISRACRVIKSLIFYIFSSASHSSEELRKDDFSDVASILLAENVKQHHLMSGPLMAVLKRNKANAEPLTLSDLIDRPISNVNTSWERFQVNKYF